MIAFFHSEAPSSVSRVFNIVINRFGSLKAGFRPWITGMGLLLTLLFPGTVSAGDSLVYTIPVREEITPGMARKFSKAMQEARTLGADLIVLHVNTYGGMLDAADSIRTAVLNCPIPVVAFIDNNAASAGALISIACNRIYMRSGANMGAATVVDAQAQQLPDKYQSYMRSMMRSTAEKRGRDPLIAEAMVDPRTYIPGINDSGKVLTLTAREAVEAGYCEGMAESLEEVYRAENTGGWKNLSFVPSAVDEIISFLVNPAVSGILLLIMLGGIYYELQSPGIGFPLIAALCAALLYFAPLYIEGLAANWEILMALGGFILLAVEVFILPGFGIAGISGIIMLIAAFTFSMIGNDGFDFSGIPSSEIVNALGVVMISMVAGIVLAFFTGARMLQSKRFSRMVLSDTMPSSEGYRASDETAPSLVGSEGEALTVLRPSGKVRIGGISYHATSENGFTAAGTKIAVTRFDGINMWVKETE